MKPEWEAADFGVLGSKLHRSNFAALQRNVKLGRFVVDER